MTTNERPADEATSSEVGDDDGHNPDKAKGDDQGGSFEINDAAPNESDEEEKDGVHSRSGDRLQGGSWQINENTKEHEG
ncbi:MAG: hypothetical protein ACFCVK_16795 [Acidimicrobiales bacterium]